MKKILLLTAAILVFQATPVFADDHQGGDKKGKMFEKHDTNGDGVISEAEFIAKAKAKFSEMDADGDGNITKEEGKKAHEAKRAKRKEKMKEKRDEWKEKRQERRENRSDTDE